MFLRTDKKLNYDTQYTNMTVATTSMTSSACILSKQKRRQIPWHPIESINFSTYIVMSKVHLHSTLLSDTFAALEHFASSICFKISIFPMTLFSPISTSHLSLYSSCMQSLYPLNPTTCLQVLLHTHVINSQNNWYIRSSSWKSNKQLQLLKDYLCNFLLGKQHFKELSVSILMWKIHFFRESSPENQLPKTRYYVEYI